MSPPLLPVQSITTQSDPSVNSIMPPDLRCPPKRCISRVVTTTKDLTADRRQPPIRAVSSSGFFEMQILEIANTNSHLLSGYCCGLPADKQQTQTTGCPACSTAFSLCLKEYQGTTSSAQQQLLLKSGQQQQQAGVIVGGGGGSGTHQQRVEALEQQQQQPSAMYGCAFGNASTPVLGSSSFVLSDSEVGRVTLPFTFRWTGPVQHTLHNRLGGWTARLVRSRGPSLVPRNYISLM
ncbi:uncharacterized protein LOC131694732 [Topomyia yanbarensis]|uniref:uncharacterized protein LOC131694732 n=1 Tax=Topomyia yanbarensis TaxID=2498891 RepID=UPI00273B9867|nr:uncharacterized protein LOC131694732 [Topomyia yanbarensis]